MLVVITNILGTGKGKNEGWKEWQARQSRHAKGSAKGSVKGSAKAQVFSRRRVNQLQNKTCEEDE